MSIIERYYQKYVLLNTLLMRITSAIGSTFFLILRTALLPKTRPGREAWKLEPCVLFPVCPLFINHHQESSHSTQKVQTVERRGQVQCNFCYVSYWYGAVAVLWLILLRVDKASLMEGRLSGVR